MLFLTHLDSRTRISQDPNNTKWARDTTTFGQKILRSHGWQPGQFLGAQNTPHSELHTTANASFIRVALKDDMKGLGFDRAKEDEITGLDVFSDLLNRLNGKSEAAVAEDQHVRLVVKTNRFVEQKYGPMRFVRGGLLVGDELKADDNEPVPDEATDETSSAEALASKKKEKKSKKRKVDALEQDEESSSASQDKKRRKGERDGKGARSSSKLKEDEEKSRLKKSKGSKKDKRAEKAKSRSASGDDAEPVDAEPAPKKRKSKSKSKQEGLSSAPEVEVEAVVAQDQGESADRSDKEKRRTKEKQEKKEKKEAKRRRKEDAETQSQGAPAAVQTIVSLSAEVTRQSTPAVSGSGTSTPQGSRNFVRSRFIAQKRQAVLDTKALNQVRGHRVAQMTG